MTPWTIQSMEFSRPEYWSGEPFPSPGDLPNPGMEHRFPALQVDSLPAEPQRRSKNTGVGSLFLLQGIFSTQRSNWGLLHCRQILFQLSYQGSPILHMIVYKYVNPSLLVPPSPSFHCVPKFVPYICISSSANRFISTIFLDYIYIYMCVLINNICFSDFM